MPKITIIDGNTEISLSTIEENIRAYMVKGEPGSDGISPVASVSKVDDTATITITDNNGTTEVDVLDGYNPRVDVTKTNRVTTLTTTDYYGTETVQISDGIDLTGGVPTNAIIGFDGTAQDIPNGYELSTETFGGGNPTGTISMFAGSTAPTGYLICDGSAISRETYSVLYNVIGTIYGSGDGSTTFNLPNLKGRIPVGLDSNDTSFDVLGETGGEKSVTLTKNNLPYNKPSILVAGGSDSPAGFSYTTNGGGWNSNFSEEIGSNQAHNNLQPYIVLNYIIKC